MVQTSARVNPYPGLRSYEFGEKYLFFGRSGLADELFMRLKQHRFLAVVGPSGSGKSSLVQAGLLPAMYGGHLREDGVHWRTVILRPGGTPVRNLAVGLSRQTVLGELLESQDENMPLAVSVESTLRQGEMGLAQVVQQANLQPNENVLIVVDAFEELFRIRGVRRYRNRQSRNESASSNNDSSFTNWNLTDWASTPTEANWHIESEATAFVSLLLNAVQQQQYPTYVVLTMRSDFIGDCAKFSGLPEAMNRSQFLVPRMTVEQQQDVIEGPIDVVGGSISPKLVDQLLADVGDSPDRLPILQHALMRTWDYWRTHHEPDEPVDIRHYEAVGTMTTALSNHADAVYEQLTVRQMDIARQLFQRLTEGGQNGRLIRHPTTLFEIARVADVSEKEVREVVNRFREGGHSFLTPPPPEALQRDTILDISHESLMRTWGRLKHWIEQERESVRQYLKLVELSTLYRDGVANLLEDPELALALNWRKKQNPTIAWSLRYSDGFENAIAYLDESEAAHKLQLNEWARVMEEQERQQTRSVNRARKIAFGSTLLAVGAVAATGLALFKVFEANRVRYQVERQLLRSEASRERALEQAERNEEDAPLFEGEPVSTIGQLSPDEFMSVEELMALDELLASNSVSTETLPSSIELEPETDGTGSENDAPVDPPSRADRDARDEASDTQPQGESLGRVTWEDGLAMRSEPNFGGARVGGVPFDAVVTVLEVSTNGAWQKIQLDSGAEGWVAAGNIEEIDNSDAVASAEQPEDSDVAPELQAPPEIASRLPNDPQRNSDRGRVTWPQGLAIRSQPSLDSSYVGGISFDEFATVLEQTQDGRWQFIRQESTGIEGWVRAGNIALD